MPRFETSQIRNYYDRNTPAFVSLGQGRSTGAIHRAVWGPGTRNRLEAFRYVEKKIIQLVQQLPPGFNGSHVVDLGCGIGSSLCYLAEHLPIHGTGITISPVQVSLAKQRASKTNAADRLVFMEGDYCNLPTGIPPADLAYAIESLVHGTDITRFFSECRNLIRPNGLLVICDDIQRSTSDPTATRTIEQFCQGWHINALLQQDELRTFARRAGFEHESTVDLSSYLEIQRPRDLIINALLSLLGRIPSSITRFNYLLGGSALQKCLKRGWIGYDLALFRRLSDTPPHPSGQCE